MKKWLGLDSPIMLFLADLTDLAVLNLLTVLCSIPVVTIGAASAALYDTIYRMNKDEGNLYRRYFWAFKENFRQATIVWVILLVGGCILSLSLWIYVENSMHIFIALSVLCLLVWSFIVVWVFPLQAGFSNSIKKTLRNAFLCGIGYLPQTMLMIVINIAPLLIVVAIPNAQSVILLYLLVWCALAAHWNLKLLQVPFSKMKMPLAEVHKDGNSDISK